MKTRFQYIKRTLLLVAFVGVGPLPVMAGPGDVDTSFQQQGAIDQPITAVAVDNNGYIWIGGRFLNVYGQSYPYLAVLNPNGTLNTNFPASSLYAVGVVHAIDIDDGNNVYVGGQNGLGRVLFIPNNQSWSVDTAFTTQASKTFRRCDTVAVDKGAGQPAQAIFGAGSVNYTNGNAVVVNNVAALFNDGTLNTGFTMPSSYVNDQVVQIRFLPACSCGPGTISYPYLLMSGTFGTIVTEGNGTVFEADADYVLSSCAAMRSEWAQYSCPSSHGELIRGGFFDASYYANSDQFLPFHLERYGESDPNWFHTISGSHLNVDTGYAIAAIDALDGGDLIVAGYFSEIDNVYVNNFAHLLPNGSVDQSFPNSAGLPVFAMAKQSDGKYVLVGETGYSPFGGVITRRFGVPPPKSITITSQPSPQTIYAGDFACFQVGVDAWPQPAFMWYKNGSPLTNQTSASFCVYGATPADDADYYLHATPFCGSSASSSTVHLTVLPPPPPPPNDLFSNAIPLVGPSATGLSYVRSATVESGEIYNGPSVWWNWTAAATGPVTLDVSGCDFSAYVSVWTGTNVANLTFVNDNCNYDCSDGCSCIGLFLQTNFQATVGTTYRIAVSGYPQSGSLGNVVLRLNPVALIPESLTTTNGVSFQATGPDSGFEVVESTTSLSHPNWIPVATNALVGGVMTFTDPRPLTNPACFYRVRLP